MYVCMSGIDSHPVVDIENFKPAIIDELLSGVDESQLISRDLRNLTPEYLSQVCFEPCPENNEDE